MSVKLVHMIHVTVFYIIGTFLDHFSHETLFDMTCMLYTHVFLSRSAILRLLKRVVTRHYRGYVTSRKMATIS